MRNAFAVPEDVQLLTVRKAGMQDIQAILHIVNDYASMGIMLPRTEFEMSENIRDFSVICDGERVIGCGALHFYSPTAAEVRSLAVAPSSTSRGAGRLIVEALEDEAISFGLHSIFAFTYVENFFAKLGFHRVERGILPLKVWKDCVRCPKFESCDEVAVLKYLPGHTAGEVFTFQSDEALIQLPVLKNPA